MNLKNAEEILARGKVDFVAMARPFVADPDFMRKSAKGHSEDIRPCVRCNTCCGRSAFFKKIRCTVNPVIGRELLYHDGKLTKAEESKKVMIIGGGLTGAESAVALAMEGNEVTLVEMQGPMAPLNGASLINKFSLQSLLAR